MRGNRTRRVLGSHPEVSALAVLALAIGSVWAVGAGGSWVVGQLDPPMWFRVIWFVGVGYGAIRLVAWCTDGGPGEWDARRNAERAQSTLHTPPEEWSIWDGSIWDENTNPDREASR